MPRVKLDAARYSAEDLSKNIRKRMIDCDVKQGELADYAGTSPATLSRKLKSPGKLTLQELRGMGKALGDKAIAEYVEAYLLMKI